MGLRVDPNREDEMRVKKEVFIKIINNCRNFREEYRNRDREELKENKFYQARLAGLHGEIENEGFPFEDFIKIEKTSRGKKTYSRTNT